MIIIILLLLIMFLFKPHIEIINKKRVILWYTNLNKERKWVLLY